MNKRILITISLLLVLVIISVFINKSNKAETKEQEKVKEDINIIEEPIKKEKVLTNTNDNKENNKTTEKENKTKKIKNKTTNTKTNTKTNKRINETNKTNKNNKTNTKTESKSENNNTSNTSTPSTPSIPTITYSCPKGYTLNGTKCNITIDASHVCPNNTIDYGNINIPQDTYCFNMSEGYEVEEGTTCPNGYGIMRIISFGGPDKYECYPLYKKIYVCDDGYTLHDTNKCTKTIDATKNN